MHPDGIGETSLHSHTIKVMAESIGISNLSDQVCEELANETTNLLKEIFRCATKFMMRCKRRKMSTADIDRALMMNNIEPLYGFSTKEFIPFRFTSGGGREICFNEDKEVELNDVINAISAKLPLEIVVKAHWLAIEGVQPAVPENPVLSKNEDIHRAHLNEKHAEMAKLRHTEIMNVRSMSTHDISVEQQFYFKEVTEGAVGSDENKRMEALNSLSSDTGLQPLVPRLIVFVAEGVKCNIPQHNLALLIYLMRMTKALCENPALSLEKCLHELLPSILSCILGEQLCARPEVDNHWALREFAARVLVQVCKQYSNEVNQLQSRLITLLANCWKNETSTFSTLFGALYSLAEFGNDTIKNIIMERLPTESERLRSTLENESPLAAGISVPSDRVGAEHLKNLIVKVLRQYVKSTTSNGIPILPIDMNEFQLRFGTFIGSTLYNQMYPTIITSSRTGFR